MGESYLWSTIFLTSYTSPAESGRCVPTSSGRWVFDDPIHYPADLVGMTNLTDYGVTVTFAIITKHMGGPGPSGTLGHQE